MRRMQWNVRYNLTTYRTHWVHLHINRKAELFHNTQFWKIAPWASTLKSKKISLLQLSRVVKRDVSCVLLHTGEFSKTKYKMRWVRTTIVHTIYIMSTLFIKAISATIQSSGLKPHFFWMVIRNDTTVSLCDIEFCPKNNHFCVRSCLVTLQYRISRKKQMSVLNVSSLSSISTRWFFVLNQIFSKTL